MKTIRNDPAWHSPKGTEPFVYVPGVLWATTGVADEVADFLRETVDRTASAKGGTPAELPKARTVRDQFVEFTFAPGSEEKNPVLEVIASLEEEHTEWRDQVWPEYVAVPFNHVGVYPARPAEPVPAPPELNGNDEGVRVVVVDIGFLASGFAWGAGSPRPNALPTTDVNPPNHNQPLSPVVGHGEAVAWIVRKYAPQATIIGRSLINYLPGHQGNNPPLNQAPMLPAFTGSQLAAAVNDAVNQDNPDIIVITSGFSATNHAKPADLVTALANAAAANIQVIAAAGNDASTAFYYPACVPSVLGVTAMEQADGVWGNACYTNTYDGHACGPGTQVTPFLVGDFRINNRTMVQCGGTGQDNLVNQTFNGGARLHGTSFATPAVAGVAASVLDGNQAATETDIRQALANRTGEGFCG